MKFHLQNNKNYRPHTSYFKETQNKGTLRVIILTAVCLLLVSLFFLSPVKRLVLHISGVLWSSETNVSSGLAMVSTPFTSNAELKKENVALKEKVFQSQIDEIKFKILEQENADLRQNMLLETGTSTENALYAGVTAYKKQGAEDLLVINKGTGNGVMEGDTVIYGGSVPIGKIIEAFGNSSIVLLFSSFDTTTPIIVGSSTQAEARGKGLGSFEIRVPKGSPVKEGDLVRLRKSTYQLALGTVGAVESVESNPFQIAYFSYPVNPNNMSYVAIIKTNE